MAITGTTTDYTGRTKDINIAFGVNPSLVGPHEISLEFGYPSTYVAGVQKLVQRYLIALLTEKGSQPGYPDFGTNLISSIHRAQSSNAQELVHIFNFASWKVVSEFRKSQSSATLPTDEQLNTVALKEYSLDGDTVSFRVNLITQAGSSVSFVLPLSMK